MDLVRFGFQKTDSHEELSTTGYIYGNITLIDNERKSGQILPGHLVTLAVMDYTYFIDYYNSHLIKPRSLACSMMFEKINEKAFFIDCNERGKLDFIRRVPCPSGKLCIDEDKKENVFANYQFTFRLRDLNQPRFWYISLSSCNRNLTTCEWNNPNDFYRLGSKHSYNSSSQAEEAANPSYTIAYDIWLVNGSPQMKSQNPFEHQYTYELHDIFEIYLTSLVFYLFLMPFIAYRLYTHFHYLYLQLLIYTGIEISCRALSLIHNLVFSLNGKGVYLFDFAANSMEAVGSSVLILILLSIAKGWTVRSNRLKTDRNFYTLGFFLQATLVSSHMISLVKRKHLNNNI